MSWTHRHVTAEQHELQWIWWRDNPRRSIRALSRQFNMSMWTARRAAEEGWQDRRIVSLKDRLAEHERTKLEQERAAAAERQREQEDERYRQAKLMNRAALAEHQLGSLGIQAAVNCLMEAGPDGRPRFRPWTKQVKRRRAFWEGEGEERKQVYRVVDEEVPLPPAEALKAAKDAASIIQMAALLIRLYPVQQAGDGKGEQGPPAELAGLQNLTPEQLQYMIDHGGELPPGLRDEDVFGPGLPLQGGKKN